MFQNMRPGRTKFSRGSLSWGRTTRPPEAATPEGPLAAINSLPTMEAFTDLSYLKTFYKQGHKASRRGTSRTSTEHSSDEEADDRGHKSSSSSRRETPTKIPVPHVPTPTRRCKKRRDEITDSEKDETGSKLNEIMGVMKDSAHDLVARSQSLAHDSSSGEGQLLPVDAWIHKQNATTQLPWFPEASLQLGIRLHHIRLSPGPQARPRISHEASTSSTSSTSSSQADHAQSHAQQYPMHTPPPPPPQDQRLPLVVDSWSCCIPSLMKWWATFLYGHFYMVIYIWLFCCVCKVSVITSLSSLGKAFCWRTANPTYI